MAFIRIEYCRVCEKETTHTNSKCNHCAEREHREYMASWKAKTVEEKLLDLHHRVMKLENNPNRITY